ncbi:MAG: hypothetical protein AB2653_04590, partial [Candidatus Thiodiazotropha endolucinida]
AIKKLVEVIMRSVWKGSGNASLAHQELEQEEIARRAHYELLESPLVADLLDPESPIAQDELLPALLSADQAEFEAAVTLFDPVQLKALLTQVESQPIPDTSGEIFEQGVARMEQIKARAKSLQVE